MNCRLMKKLLKFIVLAVLAIALFLAVFIYVQINKTYTEIIDMNWSIKLPDSYKEIYAIDSGASFHGDGERYHVFQYTNENDINQAVNWESNKDKYIETEVNKVLSELNVPEENMPDFQISYKYYTQLKDDSSKIYLLYVNNTKKLYVIEDIY